MEQFRDSALVRKKYDGMTRIGKYRVGWFCLLLLSFAGCAIAQSLDAGIPSTSVDSNVSARPQVQDPPSGEPVQAASQPVVQEVVPNAQVNSDVTENPDLIIQGERSFSAQSPAAVKLSSSIAGWSVAQRESQHAMQAPRLNGRMNDHSGVPLRTFRQFRTASNRFGRGTYGKNQPVAEDKAAHLGSLPAVGYSESDEDRATFRSQIPDSTRVPSLASPPDPGTESPLAWSPSLSVGINDIQTSPFLNPSLHVRDKRHSRNSLRRNYRLSSVSSGGSTIDQRLKPDIDHQLQDILNPPALSPLSSVDQQLNPNTNQ